MTVTRYANNFYQGLAADTKPTNVPAGAIYRATDTGDIYHYNGSSWDLIVGASKTETLTNKTLLDSGTGNQIGVHIPYTFTIYQDASNYIVRNNWTGTLQTFTNTDFAPALEWAIDNVINVGDGTQSSLYGGGIFIQRGKYVATSTINIDIDTATNHGITIDGEGWGTEINIAPAGAQDDGFLIDLAAVAIRDIRITVNDQVTNVIHVIGHGTGQRRNDHTFLDNLQIEGPNVIGGWSSVLPPIANSVGILFDALVTDPASYYTTIRNCKVHSFEKGIWFKGNHITSCFCIHNALKWCEIGIEVSNGSGQLVIDGAWIQGDTFVGTTGIKVTTGAGGYIYIDKVQSEMRREDPPGTDVQCQSILIESGIGNCYVGKHISNAYETIHTLSKTLVNNSAAVNHTPLNWGWRDKNFFTLDPDNNLVTLNSSRRIAIRSNMFYIQGSNGFNHIFTQSGALAASRTVNLPVLTGDDTFVFAAHTQTLTNKTLTSPVISTISNTGTLTLPTSTDTLVGRATTDTLTNKTLTAPVISTISNTGTLTLPTSTDTLVGRATTDTLTNKTISGASNTISNIPDSALSTNVALEDTANVFTAAQKVSLNAETVLIVHRASNTITTDRCAIDLSLNDSSNAETVIASVRTVLNTNTAGSESGQLEFLTKSSGTLARRFLVNAAGNCFIGTNARLVLTETGLTGQRTMTMPDATTTLVGTDVSQTLTNKTLGTTTISDAANIVLNTTTGTKIGTGTTQKLGFFNATPVTQRTFITSPDTTGAQLKTAVDAIRTLLSDLGLMAAS